MGWSLSRSERQQQIVFIERKGVSRNKEHTHMETFAVRSHLKNNQGAEWEKHL